MALQADPATRFMTLSGPALSCGLVLLLWAIQASFLLIPGGLIIDTHGGDALHVLDILERLSQGQQPHDDFRTPLGWGAFAPITALMAAGLPTGQAYLATQTLLAAGLGAAALAITLPRMPWPFAAIASGLIVTLLMAVVHGESHPVLSISMHYNRWCWALSFLALLAALLPPKQGSAIDGLLIGAAMAGLALIKLTYFAAFAPVVLIALIVTGQTRALTLALATSLGLAAALSAAWGLSYWHGYFSDVLFVARSEIRAQPGAGILALLMSPGTLPSTALGLTAVIILRASGLKREGLLLLLILAAGSYVTFQNYANDPLHFGLIALCLAVWAYRSTGKTQLWLAVLAASFAASIAPSHTNLTLSPMRHASLDRAAHVPLLIGSTAHQDVLVSLENANNGRQIHLVTEAHRPFYGHSPRPPLEFYGEALPNCTSVPNGNYFASIAADLAERDLAQGATIFIADIINPLWLFGDHPPLPGGMPWYYGGLPGIEAADYILFPVCPNSPGTRIRIVEELENLPMRVVARTPLYTLYRR